VKGSQLIGGRTRVPGDARGIVTVLTEPLSLWGGFDPETGRVTDAHHPQHGAVLSGRILVMPGGRGSSSSSSVLLEAARRGSHPLAILLDRDDPILVVGALVAADLYGVTLPVVRLEPGNSGRFVNGRQVVVRAGSRRAKIQPDA
jgi:predicted aconitase with swiveling domain